jgi:hypothetical protein
VIDLPLENIQGYLEDKLNLKDGLLSDEKLIQCLQGVLQKVRTNSIGLQLD